MGREGERVAQDYQKHPFLSSPEELLSTLRTKTDTGLTSAQAQESLRKYGENKLDGDGGVLWYGLLFKQMSNAMILVSPFSRFCRVLADDFQGARSGHGSVLWCL